jgi:hypothetical protein
LSSIVWWTFSTSTAEQQWTFAKQTGVMRKHVVNTWLKGHCPVHSKSMQLVHTPHRSPGKLFYEVTRTLNIDRLQWAIVKIKHYATMTCVIGEVQFHIFTNLALSRTWIISFTLPPLHPKEKSPCTQNSKPTICIFEFTSIKTHLTKLLELK